MDTPITFYLATPALVGVAMALRWQTSPHDLVGAQEYEKRQIRRTAGTIVLFIAGISLAIGITLEVCLANP
jgi:hypothetical protein